MSFCSASISIRTASSGSRSYGRSECETSEQRQVETGAPIQV